MHYLPEKISKEYCYEIFEQFSDLWLTPLAGAFTMILTVNVQKLSENCLTPSSWQCSDIFGQFLPTWPLLPSGSPVQRMPVTIWGTLLAFFLALLPRHLWQAQFETRRKHLCRNQDQKEEALTSTLRDARISGTPSHQMKKSIVQGRTASNMSALPEGCTGQHCKSCKQTLLHGVLSPQRQHRQDDDVLLRVWRDKTNMSLSAASHAFSLPWNIMFRGHAPAQYHYTQKYYRINSKTISVR